MIQTLRYDQEVIIQDILKLHSPNGVIDVDLTYSVGKFYKGAIAQPRYKFDIDPQLPGVVYGCATEIALPDDSVGTIMFDPPFLATTGPSLKKKSGNIINKRFGVFPNEKDLHVFYSRVLRETYRVVKNDGILIFKCQDKVSSGKQYFSHCYIFNEAVSIGWFAKDLFILGAKNRVVANWQRKQKHARKYHSYFWVFKKRKTRTHPDVFCKWK